MSPNVATYFLEPGFLERNWFLTKKFQNKLVLELFWHNFETKKRSAQFLVGNSLIGLDTLLLPRLLLFPPFSVLEQVCFENLSQKNNFSFIMPIFSKISGDIRRHSATFGDIQRHSATFGDIRRHNQCAPKFSSLGSGQSDPWLSCPEEQVSSLGSGQSYPRPS